MVTTRMPYPPDTGGKLRTYNLLRHLSRRHDITLVTCEPRTRPDPEFVGRICRRLITVPLPCRDTRLDFWRDAVFAPLRRDPLTVSRHVSPLMAKALCDLLRREAPDLVHCESTPLAGLVAQAADRRDCVGTQNIEAQIWLRYATTAANPVKRAYMLGQYRKVRRFEAESYPRYARRLVVSEDDRRLMREWYGLDSVVVPNGVDTEYFHPDGSVPDPRNVAYIGAMDWRPNQDAVLYFYREIWPRVKAAVPDATFTVVGRKPARSISRLPELDPSIEVTGTVEDVRPHLHRAAVCVVPLRIGGGSRLKILEALAACRPVVSTRVGAEGLTGLDRWVTIEDDSDLFAWHVIRHMVQSEARRRELASAREFVAARYSWRAASDVVEQVWLDLCDRQEVSRAA